MGNLSQRYRVLYFISDCVPTDEERADAVKYGPNCVFRNAVFADTQTTEECDAVAGKVPASYLCKPKAVPWAEWLDQDEAPEPVPVGIPPPPVFDVIGQAAKVKDAEWKRNAS